MMDFNEWMGFLRELVEFDHEGVKFDSIDRNWFQLWAEGVTPEEASSLVDGRIS